MTQIDSQGITGKTNPLDEWGLTKREFFAAMALQGMLANPDRTYLDEPQDAVHFAERLIEELNKGDEE